MQALLSLPRAQAPSDIIWAVLLHLVYKLQLAFICALTASSQSLELLGSECRSLRNQFRSEALVALGSGSQRDVAGLLNISSLGQLAAL